MNGSIKIISGTEVFTFYEDGNDFHHILNTRRYFSKYFNIPAIIGTDTDNKRIIEKYIPFNPDNFPSIKQIFNQYLHYFKNVSEENIRYFSLRDLMKKSRNLSNQSDFQALLDIIPNALYTLKFPFVPLHGDVWRANTLIEENKEKIYYIDWDESGSYIFFYDIFKCMWNEYDVNGLTEYFQSYMNGSYDNDLSKMFSAFSLTYQAEYRAAYFSLFFLNFLLAGGTMPYNIKKEELTDFKKKILPELIKRL